MPNPKQDKYQQLDTIIDKMLTSPTFRKKVADGESVSLRMAAMLIDAPHPQLSPEAKKRLQQRILDTANKTLDVSAKERILETLLNHNDKNEKQEPTLSSDVKTRVFARMLEAQQQLQLDSLVVSDEALQIARANPDPMIQAAVQLVDAPLPILSAEAKARIHQQIVPPSKAEPKRILVPNFTASIQRVAASIAILLFVSALLAPSVSADSLPGDILYPVKRSVEKVALQFAVNDAGRAQLHLQNAQERLEELSTLFNANRFAIDILDDAIVSLENAVHTSPNFAEDVVFQSEANHTFVQLERVMADYLPEMPNAIAQEFSNRQVALSQSLMVVREPVETVLPIETATPEPEVVVTDEPEIEVIVPEIITEEASVTEPLERTEETDAVILSNPVTLYVNATGAVRVRNAPSLSSGVIAQISPNESVAQLGTSDDGQWIQVELASGLQGWIAEFLLVDYPLDPTTANNSSSALENANPNGNANGNVNNNASGNANGNANNNASGNASGNANNNASGNANGNPNNNATSGNANGNANNNANGNSSNNANGNTSGNSSSNGNASGGGN